MTTEQHGASPAPAGLVALSIACFCFFALLTGKVDHSAIPLVGCWLVGGFVVQLIVGMTELQHGNLLGGNVFLFFSAFFMLTGGLEFIVKAYFGIVHEQPIDTRIDGWAWVVLTTILILWTPAYLKKGPAMLSMVVMSLDIGIIFITGMDLKIMSPAFAAPLAGWFIFAGGCFGIYVASAIILNSSFEKTILPMPGPFIK